MTSILDRGIGAAQTAIKATMGDAVTYTAGVQPAVAVTGVFDAAHEVVDLAQEPPVSTTQPGLFLTLADLPQDPAAGDTAVVAGVAYKVQETQPDGRGGVLLLMNRLTGA